jgi:hypothetical protein
MYHSKQKKATHGAKMKKALGGMAMKKMQMAGKGAKLKMVKGPDGKPIPFYAADGKGKMAMGGRMGSKEMMESMKKDDKMLQNGGKVNGSKNTMLSQRDISRLKDMLRKDSIKRAEDREFIKKLTGGTDKLPYNMKRKIKVSPGEKLKIQKSIFQGGVETQREKGLPTRTIGKLKMGHGGGIKKARGGVMIVMPVKPVKKSKKKAAMGAKMKNMKARYGAKM